MTENMTRFVHRFKVGIYLLMFLVLLFIGLRDTLHAEEAFKNTIIISEQCFWPPDMVPHPHPPQPEPQDDMASKEHYEEISNSRHFESFCMCIRS